MFVIFPAEELILMTYGAAIPRISPRPTLDCLREPQVPIVIPARSLPPSSPQLTQTTKLLAQSEPVDPKFPSALPSTSIPAPAPDSQFSFYDQRGSADQGVSGELPLVTGGPTISPRYPYPGQTPLSHHIGDQSIASVHLPPPTPPSSVTLARRNSRSSLKRSTPVHRTSIGLRKIEEEPAITIPSAAPFHIPMYNDLNMRSSQQSQQQLQSTTVPPLQGSALEFEYPTGSLQRDRSPSIFLEPSTPDPTQPRLGPGWGRPMSPMELPPEPSTSQKSPSSKSRLRPKLHIPLGRLGRSTSSDQRESYRLREDLELQVENPVFNTENLRQRNFDAFFDSGEPVYKLQPKSPQSATNESSSSGGKVSPALDNYAGVYDSSPRRGRTTPSGGLFARSHKEEATRSQTSDHHESTRDVRSASLGPGSVSVASGGSTSGVPQKGDRCPQNNSYQVLIKPFTIRI